MAKAKYKVYLKDNLNAILTIDLKIPQAMEAAFDAQNINEEERNNLMGQKLAEIIQLIIGNDEEI